MDNRQRNWYEAEHGEHPATCSCAACREHKEAIAREEARRVEEQARMRTGATERIAGIKKQYENRSISKPDARG